MDAEIRNRLKAIPQVGILLENPVLSALSKEYSHHLVKYCCEDVLSRRREEILSGQAVETAKKDLVEEVQRRLNAFLKPRLQRVFNGTGILLHTGLGRAPLLDEAYRAAFERVMGACDLELDLATGQRGDRQDKIEELLKFLTGAESAAVVNNNAAAVLLTLNTLAYRKETIVSRGQLIEIGGSFRLPEVMRKSGTKLVEIGTTNRTYLRDYESAINLRTGAVLVAHTSNYRIRGFVHEAKIGEVAALCRDRNVPLIHDLGGGVIFDLKRFKLPYEPAASDSITSGASVVTFSGDKILGGPQSGILVGKSEILRRIRKNPLMRALRPDKLTLALLEETLKLYLSPEKLLKRHPVLSRLAESHQGSKNRAERLLKLVLDSNVNERIHLSVISTKAQLGSGALPLEEFASAALRMQVSGIPAAALAMKLRLAEPPVIGYVRKESVIIDVKAIPDADIQLLARTISSALATIS